jgi:hypothetical protein
MYRLFKNNFTLEPYLHWGNYDKRRLITKFRISSHQLEIERYVLSLQFDFLLSLNRLYFKNSLYFRCKCLLTYFFRQPFRFSAVLLLIPK